MIPLLRSLLLFLMLASPVFAGEQAYTQAAFDQLQQEGKPILVDIHADWCPTCRAQAPIIAKLLKQGDYQRINLLLVDYDQQPEVVRAFRVIKQSTLIVFKGGQEVGRSLGDTRPEGIEALLKNAL